ncbi:uncharacterized protein METZ01_LOCUS189663 [marine metagenome]|jgi:uncharacterized membrane protein YvbJ|uniref:Uncharacterized protein n=1 Tax=marine metagenome TaxID=408172 RepID=A0A382DF82_9ZZZZ|tara:strand:+ start:1361 stop:1651 length:291 start_codon:yes stop_codon:yes gene_type:complete
MAVTTKQNGAELSAIERRKIKNYWARITLSWGIVATFLVLIYLLFFTEATDDNHMQLINILVGAYVAVLAKSTDYWFKEKDDPEHKETTEALQNGH